MAQVDDIADFPALPDAAAVAASTIQEIQVKQIVRPEVAIDALAGTGGPCHGFVQVGLVYIGFEHPVGQTGIADSYHMTVETQAETRVGFPVYVAIPRG